MVLKQSCNTRTSALPPAGERRREAFACRDAAGIAGIGESFGVETATGSRPLVGRSERKRPDARQGQDDAAGRARAPGSELARPHRAAAQDSVSLHLATHSTMKEPCAQLIPLYQQTEAGRNILIEPSFGGSGEQRRALESGLPADMVALSHEGDYLKLVQAGILADSWNQDDYHGMITDSVVVFVVRPGNPKGIAGWDDLVRPDVSVITSNPLTSGGGRWNILAAWGAQLKQGKSEDEAKDYLRSLFAERARPAALLPRGPRDATSPARVTSCWPTRMRRSRRRRPAPRSNT